MSLIIRGGSFVNANQDFTADFFCEDVIIHLDRSFYASYYYGAIEKRSAATAPFAVER